MPVFVTHNYCDIRNCILMTVMCVQVLYGLQVRSPHKFYVMHFFYIHNLLLPSNESVESLPLAAPDTSRTAMAVAATSIKNSDIASTTRSTVHRSRTVQVGCLQYPAYTYFDHSIFARGSRCRKLHTVECQEINAGERSFMATK